MNTSTIEQFWSKVAKDPKLKAAFEKALPKQAKPEELAKFAAAHGFKLTKEDFIRHAKAVASKHAGELSDAMLSKVAGGADPREPQPPTEDPPPEWPESPPPPTTSP